MCRDVWLAAGYRLDLLVENVVIIALKCVDAVMHEAQVLPYLRLSGRRLASLFNLDVHFKNGVRRFVV